MGIIIRQSFKASVVAYIAVAIGAVNQLFISTKFLTVEQMALSRILLENSLVFAAFAHLGIPYIADRFFVHFRKDEEKHQGFFVFLLIVPLIGILLFCTVYFLFQNQIVQYFSKESPLLIKYHFLSLPLTAFWVYITVLEFYCKNHARITVPTFVREIFLKSANILLVLIFAFGWINFDWFLYGLVGTYFLAVLILLGYIKNLGKLFFNFNIQIFKGPLLKPMLFYGLFIILGGVGQSLVLFIDRVMLAGAVGLKNAGIFILATYIAGIIEIPKKTLTQISVPILSAALQQLNMVKVKELYQKTALNQLIIGGLAFLLIACNVEDLLSILPKKDVYSNGKYVILIIGLVKIIDMAGGMSGEIILYSKYFRIVTYFIIVTAILTIIFNLIFIPLYSYNGAAIATSLATLMYVSTRLSFVWWKFKIHPFQAKYIIILILGLILWYAASYFPLLQDSLIGKFLTMGVKSLIIIIIYIGVILYLHLSEDLNLLVGKIILRIKNLRKF